MSVLELNVLSGLSAAVRQFLRNGRLADEAFVLNAWHNWLIPPSFRLKVLDQYHAHGAHLSLTF